MPDLTFDEFGLPVWTNNALTADRSGTDPDPLGAAMAAVNAIGVPNTGIPYPQNQPAMSPGAQPVGAPPADVPGNELLGLEGDFVHPSPDAVSLPPVGNTQAVTETGLPLDAIAGAASGPVPLVDVTPAAAEAGKQSALRKGRGVPGDPVDTADLELAQTQEDAATAEYQRLMAQNQAQAAMADRRAAAMEQRAAQQAGADAQYQGLRDRAQADADRETAQWMMQMEDAAKKEPNPSRWFHSKSTAGKALFLLSLAFGTKAAMTAPGVQNIGLAMWKEEMDRDLNEQRAAAQREMEVLRTKGQLIDRKTAQRLAMLRDDHSIRAGQLLALEKAALERANAPGSEDDKAAFAAAHSWLTQQRMATAATKSQRAFQEKESRLARAHSAHQAQLQRQFNADENALDRTLKLMLADIEMATKTAQAGAGASKDYQTLDPKNTGIVSVQDGPGGKSLRPVKVHKEVFGEVNKISQASHMTTSELLLLRDALQDGTFLSKMAGGDPKLNAALTRSGYAKAKELDPRGIVTNADFANGLKATLGFDYSTAVGRGMAEAKLAATGHDIIKYIDDEINRIEVKTNQELNATVPVEQGGGTLVWRAVNRNTEEVKPETLGETKERVAGVQPLYKMPSTTEELKQYRAEGTLAPYREEGIAKDAAGYKRGTRAEQIVNEATIKFRHLAPKDIDTLAQGYRDAVEGDSRAQLEIDAAVEAARTKAKEREEDAKNALIRDMYTGKGLTRKGVVEVLREEGLGESAKDPAYVTEVLDAVRAVSPYKKK